MFADTQHDVLLIDRVSFHCRLWLGFMVVFEARVPFSSDRGVCVSSSMTCRGEDVARGSSSLTSTSFPSSVQYSPNMRSG